MKNYDAVIFDLDDTLILENDFINSAYCKISVFMMEEFGFNQQSVYNDLLSLRDENSKTVFERFLNKNRCYSPDIVKKMVEIYKYHLPNIKMIADVEPILQKLKNSGVKLGIITDGDEGTQKRKLQAINAEKYFDVIIVSDEYGIHNRKPSAFPYVKCLENLKINDFSRTVYVGDNIAKDFVTAKKIGMVTVQILRNEGIYKITDYPEEYQAHFQIGTMNQLLSVLGELK